MEVSVSLSLSLSLSFLLGGERSSGCDLLSHLECAAWVAGVG